MRSTDRDDLAVLLELASEGRLRRAEVVAMFMYLRADADPQSSIKDIGNTVAHDERNRGPAFNYVQGHVEAIKAALVNDGRFESGVLFPIGTVIDELVELTTRLGLHPNSDALHRKWAPLALRLLDVLDGTRFVLDDADAYLTGGASPALVIRFHEDLTGAVNVPAHLGLAFPLLIDDSEWDVLLGFASSPPTD